MSGIVQGSPVPDRLGTTDREWTRVGSLVTDIAYTHPLRLPWWIAILGSLGLVGVLVLSVGWLLYEGVGIWGNNVPVTWALDIVGYDWWIGVATGSVTISAMLLLTRAEWSGAVNRLAQTTALLGVAAAGLYPIIHLGRPWFFYWNLPYPNTFLLWPQFRSPLYWDAIDIVSFLGIAFLYWFTTLVPDLASMRDRAVEAMQRQEGRPGEGVRLLKARLYGITSLGWRGSVVHWQRWEHSLRIMAVFGLVLVASLQTGAAVMFSGSVEPGWHDAMLPVSYLFGAVFGGVGMVAAIMVVVRAVFPLRPLITPKHFAYMAGLLLMLAVVNLYCYATSFGFTALAGDDFDKGVLARRFVGAHSWATWAIIVCSLVPPHIFWIPAARRSGLLLALVGLLVAFGVWSDHFMVIVDTLQHDFLPSSVHPYAIDIFGVATFLGTVGLFLFLMLMFLRYIPVASIYGLSRMHAPEGVHQGVREGVRQGARRG